MIAALTDTFDVLDIAGLSEEDMANRIPSNIFIAKGVPLQNGKFHAVYAAPGLTPVVSSKDDGTPYVYNTEEEAEAWAAKHLHRVLNAPRQKANSKAAERYQKLTGSEFAVLLARAGVTRTWFAYVYGTSEQRVFGWIDGVDQVPHPARLLLELIIADEKNAGIVEAVTDQVTTERKPRRVED